MASGDEYAIWNLDSWARVLQIPRSQAAGMPGVAAFSPRGDVLAIARTRNLVQLLDVKSGRDLATLESPELNNIAALSFSPDGRLLVVALVPAGMRVWDLDAVRRGVESVGLPWPAAIGDGPTTKPVFTPKKIVVEEAPWMAALARGGELARSERWKEAGDAYEEAVAQGAVYIEAQFRRALFRLVRGDHAAYSDGCRQIVRTLDAVEIIPSMANDIAWTCALGPGALQDYSRAIELAKAAVAQSASGGRLNTLGAILYRAGKFDEAIRQLERAIEVHGAGGTTVDALFSAMAHHKLGHADQAKHWLRIGTAAEAVEVGQPVVVSDMSWIGRLENEILRRESRALIEP
jgi:tetratricopeptide (TPR) repeat protein